MTNQHIQQLNYLEAMSTESLEDLRDTLLKDSQQHIIREEYLEVQICKNKINLIDRILTSRAV